ncbi:HNH endonuclease, partial [Staphylococcus aureus]
MPISEGGTNEMSNLTVLCQKCNCSRKNRVGNSNIFDSVDCLQIEHKIPISEGGTNEMSNLTVLCQKCNCSRKNRVGN